MCIRDSPESASEAEVESGKEPRGKALGLRLLGLRDELASTAEASNRHFELAALARPAQGTAAWCAGPQDGIRHRADKPGATWLGGLLQAHPRQKSLGDG